MRRSSWVHLLSPERARNGIYLGDLALPRYPVCRLPRGHADLILRSIADGHAAIPHFCVDLDEAQVWKYLALRHLARIAQHVHPTVLRPAHRVPEQNRLCIRRVRRCAPCPFYIDGCLSLEATG